MDTKKVTILEWREDSKQVKLKEEETGDILSLENCDPSNGCMLVFDSAYKFHTLGQLVSREEQLGPWVLHSNDKQKGVLCEYGQV